MITASKECRQFIELVEESGVAKLKPYDDGVGVLTIGYGHTTTAGPPKVYPGMRITAEQADAILASDLRSVEIEVEHLVKVPLDQNQFDVLVSFQFNTGKLAKSTLLKKLNAGAYGAVPNELQKWVRGGGRVLGGLVKRRKCEAVYWNGDVEEALAMARKYFGKKQRSKK